MAHLITVRARGFAEFAYAAFDGAAWHRLGQEVPEGASTSEWTKASGMDWAAVKAPVMYAVGDDLLEDNSKNVVFRDDTRAPLGVVGAGYKLVQPSDVMAFFERAASANGFRLSAAGTLQGGRRFWATAKIDEAAPVSVRDRIGAYLLLSTSCDGSLATEARLTTTRVVCANTLRIARGWGKPAVRVTHRSEFREDDVLVDLGILDGAWVSFRREMVRLANRPMDKAEAEAFATKHVGAEGTAGWSKVMALFNGQGLGSDLDGVLGTRYGMLQAVTEYADHHVRARSAENRFLSGQWGPGDAFKAKAFDALVAA